jgi:hypothetical protein
MSFAVFHPDPPRFCPRRGDILETVLTVLPAAPVTAQKEPDRLDPYDDEFIPSLAKKYGVSVQALTLRLHYLGYTEG